MAVVRFWIGHALHCLQYHPPTWLRATPGPLAPCRHKLGNRHAGHGVIMRWRAWPLPLLPLACCRRLLLLLLPPRCCSRLLGMLLHLLLPGLGRHRLALLPAC